MSIVELLSELVRIDSVNPDLVPGGAAEAEVAAFADACRAADPELEATQHTLLAREPFEIERDAEIVELTVSAATGVLGRPPAIGGASFWADSAFIARAGIPTVLLGPGGEGAHAIEEWVSLSDTEAVMHILTAVAARVCA